jgi:hypothetical protein
MPIAALVIGIIMIDLAFRGTEHQFAQQAVKDFGGGSQFYAWGASIVIIGALGYVPGLQKVSSGLLALVIIVLVLAHGGAFATLAGVIEHPPAPSPSVSISSYKAPPPSTVVSNSGGGGGGGLLGPIASIASSIFG